ncbi:MAG: FG-GAP-like repeat-containing protein [Thermoguttaceae bacterium]|jgi:hypothetical protein
MARNRSSPIGPGPLLALAALLVSGRAAWGYVEAAYSAGQVVNESSNVLLVRVESVDRQKNLIVYSKVRDIKGTHPSATIKHNIGQAGFNPREWQNVMAWAAPGKAALIFHNGAMSETCIENYWYQCGLGDWWQMTHAEPYLLRTFAGKPEKLAAAVAAMLAGQEVVVSGMVDGDKNALQLRTARIQRLRAGLKLVDYNPKRDFVEFGGAADDFRAIEGMPGFTHFAALPRTGLGAAGIAPADFNGDGKMDLCLFSASRVVLLQNAGGSFDEVHLPLEGGARAAAWADYDGDGKPDLLLATPTGPRLFHNDGKQFEDVTYLLPLENYYNLKAAAWIDYDGDGKPDILLADGFRGLRLYRNKGVQPQPASQPKVGKWYYAGPFDNPDHRGFDIVYPPEREIDLGKQYTGKNGEKVVWREGTFRDGQINDLRLFKADCNENCAIYLYRELDYGGATEIPVSMGSDDTLTVWLNGRKIHAENVYRGCQPDQVLLRLKLRPGRNALLLKVCQGTGDFAFYYLAKGGRMAVGPPAFEDVSDAVGLGAAGIAANLKGDHLAVADVNGDGRPDFLYSAGNGVLVLNTPHGFVEAKDSGILYQAGGVAPVFGDFLGDGRQHLFVPQQGISKLFRNDGRGHFTDATARAGDLARPAGQAVCAAWSDFRGCGRPDLFVGCFRGPNRYFRNNGDGTFTDATDAIGLRYRIFNTAALAVLDLNNDKMPDVVFNNEGQESAVLLGNAAWDGRAAAKSVASPASEPPQVAGQSTAPAAAVTALRPQLPSGDQASAEPPPGPQAGPSDADGTQSPENAGGPALQNAPFAWLTHLHTYGIGIALVVLGVLVGGVILYLVRSSQPYPRVETDDDN